MTFSSEIWGYNNSIVAYLSLKTIVNNINENILESTVQLSKLMKTALDDCSLSLIHSVCIKLHTVSTSYSVYAECSALSLLINCSL